MITRRAIALALTVVALGACGGDEPTVEQSPGRKGVSLQDNQFVPAELTVGVGAEVIWVDNGDNDHSVTAADGAFDSHPKCPPGPCMKKGDIFKHTFNTAGRFTYSCRIHGELMSGAIVVE